MSEAPEVGRQSAEIEAKPNGHLRTPSPRAAREARSRPLELIACGGCGRRFATSDGPGMIASIKGPCPDCGGQFQLVGPSAEGPLD